MPLHKIVLGGENWLPFALSKLRSMKQRLGDWGYGSSAFTMPDGAEVKVRQVGEQQFVRIDGGTGYEFFTSERIDSTTLSTPSGPLVPNGAGGFFRPVLGSGVYYKGGASAKAIFSTALSASPEGPQWVTLPPDASGYPPEYRPNYFTTWASWQHQKLSEHVWWPSNKATALVTSTAGIAPGIANQAGWLHVTKHQQGGLSRAQDSGRDVVPAYYDRKGAMAGAPFLPSNIWWRHAAVQTVRSAEFGARKFFVLTDTHGRFHIYPVKKYQDLFTGGDNDHFTSLPESAYKTYMPPYPSWVTLPNLAEENRYGQWYWSFNKDATKAVSIPVNRRPATLWVSISTGSDSAPDYAEHPLYVHKDHLTTEPQFVYDPDLFSTLDPADYLRAQEDTPGLVEFSIVISVSGAGDMDYDATFLLERNEYFTDSNRYFSSAAYLLPNVDGAGSAQEDDLVVAEAEAFWLKGPDTTTIFAGGMPPLEVAAESRIARHKSDVVYPPGYEPSVSFPTEHRYEEGLSDMNLGRFMMEAPGIELDGYITVRQYDTGEVLRRIPILAGEVYGSPLIQISPPEGNGFTPVAPTTSSVWRRTSIRNLDLRSLSFVLTQTDVKHGTPAYSVAKTSVIAFNRHRAEAYVHSLGGPYVEGEGPYPLQEMSEALRGGRGNLVTTCNPADLDFALLILQSLTLLSLQTVITQSLNIHPNGSWASSVQSYIDFSGELDIIAAKGRKLTTHREMFNKAFGQERGYGYYGEISGPNLDMGSFCVSGIWKTF